ncbi:MAG TPA: AbrB/MazE/SpoVT family DNA-binding domain-containing protein [Thermoanaerobaculia bacterium]|nr:AbrB/MazE/SpoVT family DNA-binding domain-containing protein [Thermoanaerobaculia bacterium]
MAHLVGEKGQLVIEKPIRETLGIQPGFVAVQTVVGDHAEIRFYPPEHRRSLHGRLERYAKRSVSEEQWAQAREAAWATAVGEEDFDR